MDTLKINTSQNIAIEQPIASVGERIAATLIDYLIISGYYILLAFIISHIKSTTLWVIASIPVIFYGLLCEITMNGQSFGKKVFNIKVVQLDGTQPSFINYFLRWIIGIIEIYGSLGSIALFAIILNQKGQRLGDLAAGTTMIRLNKKGINKNIFTEVPENYTVVFPEAARLSVSDIYTLEEVLALLKSPEYNKQNIQIAAKAREAIEKKLSISSKLTMIQFFETILRDYNYLNSGH